MVTAQYSSRNLGHLEFRLAHLGTELRLYQQPPPQTRHHSLSSSLHCASKHQLKVTITQYFALFPSWPPSPPHYLSPCRLFLAKHTRARPSNCCYSLATSSFSSPSISSSLFPPYVSKPNPTCYHSSTHRGIQASRLGHSRRQESQTRRGVGLSRLDIVLLLLLASTRPASSAFPCLRLLAILHDHALTTQLVLWKPF